MSYLASRLAEIRRVPPSDAITVAEWREINSRFNYARRYRAAFDLWWRPKQRAIVLRIVAGRRLLKVPSDALHVGRYDAASLWDDVKADFLATIGRVSE